jgi:putative serine protease PepD
MTMTYEPFTPAGSSEPRQYGGRRRAEERAPESEEPVRGHRWSEPVPETWAEPAQDARATPAPADPWGEPRGRRVQEWGRPEGLTEAPAEPERQWVEDPRWQATPQWQAPAQRQAAQQQAGHAQQAAHPQQQPSHRPPSWHEDLAAPVPAPLEPVAPQRSVPSRYKPVVVGVVVLLLLIAGWQAYRIEGMSDHNADMASVLTAQKDRTDQLEKQLAGVFDPEAVSSSALPSVFRVRAGNFTGTAFSVGRKAKAGESNLMTNYHVVAEVWTGGGRKVSLERGSTKITATIVDVDKGKDLALLHADQKIAGLATATATVKPGQQVVVVGAPLGLDDTVTTGVISAYRPDDPDGPTIQFDAPINPGNSGGPVVNAANQVVGLATAKAKDAEGIGLAIPIKTACATFTVC